LPGFLREPGAHHYDSENYCVFDAETTTHKKGLALYPENSLLLFVWYNGPEHPRPGWHHKWGSELEQEELLADLRAADFSVAHNAKFDLQWLHRCGADLDTMLVWDTSLAEYVRGGQSLAVGRPVVGALRRSSRLAG
jgi:hypothetical protein